MSQKKSLEQIKEKENHRKTASRHRRPAGIFVVCYLVLFFSLTLFFIIGKEYQTSRTDVITPDNVNDVLDRLIEDEASAPFQITMNSCWIFETGAEASSNAYVENSASNQNTVYFTVSLSEDNSSLLYVSPNLEVGNSINNIQLDYALDAGTYDAILTYYLLDENNICISNIPVKLQLVINSS